MSSIALPVLSEDRGLTQYLQEIRKFPLLSAEEEFMLAKRWREHGDSDAAHKLVTSHLRLVVKMAMRYRGYRLPLSDLISEGNVGLMKAVRKFDPDKGFRLSTYAMWWIKAAITEFVLKSWSIVRVGSLNAQKRLFFSLRRAKAQLDLMDGGELTPAQAQELAERYRLPAADIARIDRRLAARDISLNRPVGDSETGEEIIDRLHDESADPELLFAEAEEESYRRALLDEAIAALDDRDREIIQARWMGEDPLTLEELGKRLGISRERVRQLEERAIGRIKAHLQSRYAQEQPAELANLPLVI